MDDREQRWSKAMRAAIGGDGAAYARLLSEVASVLRRRAQARLARFGLSPDEAEDVVQETLMALHAKRGSWDPSRPFMPWLNAVADHKLLDAARRLGRARRRTAALPVEEIAERLPAEPSAISALAGTDPERAIAGLPDRERGVVSALGIEGLSIAGTAARFAISEVAVRVAFHRGLARLSKLAEARATAERPLQKASSS